MYCLLDMKEKDIIRSVLSESKKPVQQRYLRSSLKYMLVIRYNGFEWYTMEYTVGYSIVCHEKALPNYFIAHSWKYVGFSHKIQNMAMPDGKRWRNTAKYATSFLMFWLTVFSMVLIVVNYDILRNRYKIWIFLSSDGLRRDNWWLIYTNTRPLSTGVLSSFLVWDWTWYTSGTLNATLKFMP